MIKLSNFGIILFFFLVSCKKKLSNIEDSIKDFQYQMNIHFSDKKTSPLTDENFKTFTALAYFPINKELVINATFKATPNEPSFKMLTTTSRVVDYKKYGIASFTINNKTYQLNIYQNLEILKDKPNYDDLFLPFKDLTNGKKTYEGGRYIDLKIPKNDTLVIDFNKSYNPYCAYNNKYSCPIPPSDNSLNMPINAGVLAYDKQH